MNRIVYLLIATLLSVALGMPKNGALLFCEDEEAKFVSVSSRIRVFAGKNCVKKEVKAVGSKGPLSNYADLWKAENEDHKSLIDLSQFMYICKKNASITLRRSYKAQNGKIRWRKIHSVST